ncbi:MAG: 1-acyl-sn-glycerol-3-phosphate acyltransferase [Cyclobacteriaceae bacterium]
MLKALFKLIFKLQNWKLHQPTPPEAKKAVMIAAPHTSNWDFVFAISAMDQLGLNPRFTIKKEFNFFPLGSLIANLGAIWIDRSKTKKGGMTEFMVSLFTNDDQPLTVVVTPEGTRSPNPKWKTGFYYAALEAKMPICLSFMDYDKKVTGVGMCFMPSGNIEDDMKKIMDFYSNVSPKFPENFVTDERYS